MVHVRVYARMCMCVHGACVCIRMRVRVEDRGHDRQVLFLRQCPPLLLETGSPMDLRLVDYGAPGICLPLTLQQ